jgi:hypothetical protein
MTDQPSPATIAHRLAAFEQSAKDDRVERHAELVLFARRHHVPDLEARHAEIEAIGPWEAKAFELLSRGIDPGTAAIAFVQQFIANSYGDPERGLSLPTE